MPSLGVEVVDEVLWEVCLQDGEALLHEPAPACRRTLEDGDEVVVSGSVLWPSGCRESPASGRQDAMQLAEGLAFCRCHAELEGHGVQLADVLLDVIGEALYAVVNDGAVNDAVEGGAEDAASFGVRPVEHEHCLAERAVLAEHLQQGAYGASLFCARQVDAGLVEIEAGASASLFDELVERWHWQLRALAPVRLESQGAYLVECHLADGACAVCRAVDCGVVHHDEMSVACPADVCLDDVGAEEDGVLQGLQGVLGGILPVGAMSSDEDVLPVFRVAQPLCRTGL